MNQKSQQKADQRAKAKAGLAFVSGWIAERDRPEFERLTERVEEKDDD